jgi:hypothetical protein
LVNSVVLSLVGFATAVTVFVLTPVAPAGRFGSSQGAVPGSLPAFFDRTLDPPIGERLLELLPDGPDVYGRMLPHRQQILVVYGGTCSSCSLAQVSPSSFGKHPGFTICLVFDADRDDVLEQLGKEAPAGVLVFSDPTAHFSMRSNAAWVGRWYMFDQGRLKQVQQRPEESPW